MGIPLRQNLFLLEFLIDEIFIHPGAIEPEIENAIGEICITIQFLDNKPIEICEADFSPKCCSIEPTMRNGKSCVFAIPPGQYEELSTNFNINVKVFKKFEFGTKPNKAKIGLSKISLSALFNEILDESQSKAEGTTISKTMKDIYPVVPLKLINKCCIGDITAFIRLSCFGKLLITQFQMNLEENTVFYKDKEGKRVYKYRKACNTDENQLDCEICFPGDTCIKDTSFYFLGCNTPCYYPPCSSSPSSNSSPVPADSRPPTAFSCPYSRLSSLPHSPASTSSPSCGFKPVIWCSSNCH